MTSNPTHGFCKSRRIADLRAVLILARVESERLLVHVTKQMEGLYGNVRSGQSALQQRPEVLDSLRVNGAIHVMLKMVDDLVRELPVSQPATLPSCDQESRGH